MPEAYTIPLDTPAQAVARTCVFWDGRDAAYAAGLSQPIWKCVDGGPHRPDLHQWAVPGPAAERRTAFRHRNQRRAAADPRAVCRHPGAAGRRRGRRHLPGRRAMATATPGSNSSFRATRREPSWSTWGTPPRSGRSANWWFCTMPACSGRRRPIVGNSGSGTRCLQHLLARSGATIATVSEFSRDEICRHLGLPPDRVAVIGEGAEHMHGLVAERGILVRSATGAAAATCSRWATWPRTRTSPRSASWPACSRAAA